MKARMRGNLSKESQQIVNDEIRKQIMYHAERHALCYDGIVLLTLHLKYGFGKKRLREFYDNFSKCYDELREYYKFVPMSCKNGTVEAEFYALEELKNIGVDLAAWRDLRDNWKAEDDKIWQEH